MMKFISVRDLRSKSAQVWRELGDERELVLTSNGKPIAIVSATDEDSFEESLRAIRKSRALRAVEILQAQSIASGRDRLPPKDIEDEVAAVRRGRQS
jgi:antitoxin (DNA-binding transcriptional repressor) of toxin-antitoxin stability system